MERSNRKREREDDPNAPLQGEPMTYGDDSAGSQVEATVLRVNNDGTSEGQVDHPLAHGLHEGRDYAMDSDRDLSATQDPSGVVDVSSLTGLAKWLMTNMATKSDLEKMATKSDLEKMKEDMATKSDLGKMATKSDLETMATKSDLETMKEDMATKSDLGKMKEGIESTLTPMKTILYDPLVPVVKRNLAWVSWAMAGGPKDPMKLLAELKEMQVDFWQLIPVTEESNEPKIIGWKLVGHGVVDGMVECKSEINLEPTAGFIAQQPPWVMGSGIIDRIIRPADHLPLLERLIVVHKILGGDSVNRKGLLLCGNPGIGKSLFIDVLASMLLSFKKPGSTFHVMIYHNGSLDIFTEDLESHPVRVTHRSVDLAARAPAEFIKFLVQGVRLNRTDRVILLHDIQADNGQPYNATLVEVLQSAFDTYTICVCSPDGKKLRGAEKDFDSVKHYFSVFTENESICFAKLTSDCEDEDEAAKWYRIVSGTPRHLKSRLSVEQFYQKMLEAPKYMSTDPLTQGGPSDTNRLVKVEPASDPTSSSTVWLSPVARAIWERFHKSSRKNSDMLLEQLNEGGGLCGQLFQRWAERDEIFSGPPNSTRTFIRRQIHSEPSGSVAKWSYHSIPSKLSLPGDDLSGLVQVISAPSIAWPASITFPVIDCLLLEPASHTASFIQMTVGVTHRFIAERFVLMVEQVVNRGFVNIEFIWAVPPGSSLNPPNLVELVTKKVSATSAQSSPPATSVAPAVTVTSAAPTTATDTAPVAAVGRKPKAVPKSDAEGALQKEPVKMAVASMKQYVCYLSPLHIKVKVSWEQEPFELPVRSIPSKREEVLDCVRLVLPTVSSVRKWPSGVWEAAFPGEPSEAATPSKTTVSKKGGKGKKKTNS